MQIALARNKYSFYVEYVHEGRWLPAKHLLFICDEVEKLINNQTDHKILIIQMPPQHGKSQTITETLPSYYLGKNPSKRVIVASYGDDLARRFGRRNKQKINQFGKELFDIELSSTSKSDTDFELKNGVGAMMTRGITAGITGQPGDLVIIDDPVKNRQEADSATYRDRVWGEFLYSIWSRLSAKAKVIIIQTRWHEDDLAGRVIKYLGEFTKVISLPCEAEENDPLGRKEGDALFPEIGKNKEWLEEYKRVYSSKEGSRAWLALYQQRPTAQEGNLIKRAWWKYYKEKPKRFDQILQSWDCTFKDSDGSDYVVGSVWGRVGADKYLLDIHRQRMDLPTTINAILTMSQKWPQAKLKLIEDKANGSAIIQMLQKQTGGIVPINPMGSKLARVQAVLPHIESGNVYLPKDASWVGAFLDECSSFPNGKHDDQVDSMSQALIRLIDDYSTYQEPKTVDELWVFKKPTYYNNDDVYIRW